LCSKHNLDNKDITVQKILKVSQGTSPLRNKDFKYYSGNIVEPTNLDEFKIRSESCGIGIHFCTSLLDLFRYITPQMDNNISIPEKYIITKYVDSIAENETIEVVKKEIVDTITANKITIEQFKKIVEDITKKFE
jgi:hypothetical protein